MQYDLAAALVDSQVARLSIIKQLEVKLCILINQQPHSCVRKAAFDFLEQNLKPIVGAECGRVLDEIEFVRQLVNEDLGADEYLPLTIDQERLVGGNSLRRVFELAERAHGQFLKILGELKAENCGVSTASLEAHLESFDLLLSTIRPVQERAKSRGCLPKLHKIVEYEAETDMPESPSRCLSARLLKALNSGQRAKSEQYSAKAPKSALSMTTGFTPAVKALEKEYRECESEARQFRRSVLRQHYDTHQMYSRKCFIKSGIGIESAESSPHLSIPPDAAISRFRKYPQPPAPPGYCGAEKARPLLEGFDAKQMGKQFSKELHEYENCIFRDLSSNVEETCQKGVMAVRNRWVGMQNEHGELHILNARILYALSRRALTENEGEQFRQSFEAWAEQVRDLAELAPIPSNYVAIDAIQGRRTCYANIITGKVQTLRPEVVAVQKWIDSEWRQRTEHLEAAENDDFLAALDKICANHYFLSHRSVGSVLLDNLLISEVQDVLTNLQTELRAYARSE